MSRRRRRPTDPMTVTFHPDAESGGRYGVVECSWEDEPRKTPIAASVVENFAAGWKAKLIVEAAW